MTWDGEVIASSLPANRRAATYPGGMLYLGRDRSMLKTIAICPEW